eukprot:1535046-Pleurochrysis_carterae.AAC.2
MGYGYAARRITMNIIKLHIILYAAGLNLRMDRLHGNWHVSLKGFGISLQLQFNGLTDHTQTQIHQQNALFSQVTVCRPKTCMRPSGANEGRGPNIQHAG